MSPKKFHVADTYQPSAIPRDHSPEYLFNNKTQLLDPKAWLADDTMDLVLKTLSPNLVEFAVWSSQHEFTTTVPWLIGATRLTLPIHLNNNQWAICFVNVPVATIEVFDGYQETSTAAEAFQKCCNILRKSKEMQDKTWTRAESGVSNTFCQHDPYNGGVIAVLYGLCRMHNVTMPVTFNPLFWRRVFASLFGGDLPTPKSFWSECESDEAREELRANLATAHQILDKAGLVGDRIDKAMESHALRATYLIASDEYCTTEYPKVDQLTDEWHNLYVMKRSIPFKDVGQTVAAMREYIASIEREQHAQE